ncbi:hypothetical protein D3C71_1554150 [compost metagenome]
MRQGSPGHAGAREILISAPKPSADWLGKSAGRCPWPRSSARVGRNASTNKGMPGLLSGISPLAMASKCRASTPATASRTWVSHTPADRAAAASMPCTTSLDAQMAMAVVMTSASAIAASENPDWRRGRTRTRKGRFNTQEGRLILR